MYYPDFTVDDKWYLTALMVGWLDPDHDYPRGEVTEDFLDQLFEFCGRPQIMTMGYHRCGFSSCKGASSGLPTIARNGQEIAVGYSEFYVEDDGILFCAPSLIYHYVHEHRYLPPARFINAVMKSRPGELQFQNFNEPDLSQALFEALQVRADEGLLRHTGRNVEESRGQVAIFLDR